MRILAVVSEIFPLIKTGGLADVAGALPGALAAHGVDMRSLVPGYPAVKRALTQADTLLHYDHFFGGEARLLAGKAADLDLFVLDAPHLFDRVGNPYTAADGRDWSDNAQRFAALARMAAIIGKGALGAFVPDIVHAHDWQAGLTPAYLHYDGGARPATVLTIHNLAFQGQFDSALLAALGLPARALAVDGVEYYGTIGYLKAGIQFADRITTVSPTYALEILLPATGMGLDGLLRKRSDQVRGILNGIDLAVWDPAHDADLVAPYDLAHIERRAANTAALQQRMGLAVDPQALLFGVISRLSWQKGLDLLADVMPGLVNLGQLALLGAGDRALEARYIQAAETHPRRVGCVLGYDEEIAHQSQGGADVLLVPSRFEPCGLTQLCALRYGAIPLVARVGGLADTVIDTNEVALAAGVATGLQFAPVNATALYAALDRAARMYADPALWARVQANGMRTDVSWTLPAQRYAELYRDLLSVR